MNPLVTSTSHPTTLTRRPGFSDDEITLRGQILTNYPVTDERHLVADNPGNSSRVPLLRRSREEVTRIIGRQMALIVTGKLVSI